MKKRKLSKYEVVYEDADGEIHTIKIEAQKLFDDDNCMIFLDEQALCHYIFYKKDIITYKEI